MNSVHTVYPEDGQLALWDAPPFAHIDDYEVWEAELADPATHVEAGSLVLFPAGDVQECQVEVHLGGNTPGEPFSGPHRFVVTGPVRLSGLNAIGGVPWDNTAELDVPEGRYTVTVHRDDRGVLVVVLGDLGGE